MIKDSNVNSLAETLAKSGLVSSTSQAVAMAKDIMGTEKRVSSHFDKENEKIEDGLTREKDKKTYKEEIDELIEKTSPEKKDFHVMVSGYKKDRKPELVKEVEEVLAPVKTEVEKMLEEPVEEEDEPEEEPEPEKPEPVEEKPVVEQPQPEVKPEPVQEVKSEPVEPVMKNQAVSEAIEKAVPVHTDVLNDDRMLKEVMDEQAEEVYTNKSVENTEEASQEMSEPEQAPEYNVVNMEAPVQEEEPQPEVKEEFILPVSEPEPEPVKEQPEQMFKEVTEPPKQEESEKEFKNPIQEVDLLDHFKFG